MFLFQQSIEEENKNKRKRKNKIMRETNVVHATC